MFLRMAPATAVNAKPATGGGHGPCTQRPPLWNDEFFWIADGTAEFIQVRVRRQYNRPVMHGGMGGGTATMTKLIHPREFGEPRDAPVRSLLLLRTWAVWRARQDGWADARSSRKHQTDEQEASVERAVRALDEPCRLLGNEDANVVFQPIAPDMASRLLARR